MLRVDKLLAYIISPTGSSRGSLRFAREARERWYIPSYFQVRNRLCPKKDPEKLKILKNNREVVVNWSYSLASHFLPHSCWSRSSLRKRPTQRKTNEKIDRERRSMTGRCQRRAGRHLKVGPYAHKYQDASARVKPPVYAPLSSSPLPREGN